MRINRLLCCLLCLALCLAALPVARAESAKIVTSFYPIYAMAANLLKDVPGVELTCLAPPSTGCLHDVALLPGDMQSLVDADALLLNGAGMESYLDDVLSAFPELTLVDASVGVTLLPNAEEHHEEEAGHEEHDHGEYNAHIWLSVPNAMQMTRNLSDALAALLPEQAEAIERNRDAYCARLEALDAELRAGLAPYAGREIVTFHAAFAYFAQEYGLDVLATMSEDPESSLSAGEMAELCQLLVAHDLPPLFVEPAYDASAADVLAAETGAPVYTLDPVTTGSLDDSALTHYEDAMRLNLQTLVEAFTAPKP